MAKRVFLSFKAEDKQQVQGLRLLAANPNFDIDFFDESVRREIRSNDDAYVRRKITEKINRGEGTLGALVNNSVLYDGAEEVVAGVNDSKFARWLLRHYQKKGIKAGEQAKTDGDEED